MPGTLGCTRVSTGEQDVTGQVMRLSQAGAIKVFTDVRSGRTMDCPGLREAKLIAANLSPSAAACRSGFNRSTVYQKMSHAGPSAAG